MHEGLTLMQWYDLLAEIEARACQPKPTCGHQLDYMNRLVPIKGKAEPPIPIRVPCTAHREKSYTFTDGSTWKACTADDCMWGKGRKTHSNGSSIAVEVEGNDEGIEVSPDDPQELLASTPERVAGEETTEPEPNDEDIAFEAAVDAAADEEREDYE